MQRFRFWLEWFYMVCTCYGTHVEVRGHSGVVSSLLLPCVSQHQSQLSRLDGKCVPCWATRPTPQAVIFEICFLATSTRTVQESFLTRWRDVLDGNDWRCCYVSWWPLVSCGYWKAEIYLMQRKKWIFEILFWMWLLTTILVRADLDFHLDMLQ